MIVTDLTPEECGPLTRIYIPQVPTGDFFEEMDKSTQMVIHARLIRELYLKLDAY